MADEEKKSFFKSKAFILILVWLALGVALTFGVRAAAPAMQRSCEEWAKELSHATPGEHGEDAHAAHGEEGHHDYCHLVAVQGTGTHKNLAAAFHGIVGTDGKMTMATAWSVPNFLILVTLLVHFAGGPMSQGMKDKRAEMEKAIKEAAEAKAAADRKRDEYERKLASMDREIEDLKASVRKDAESEREKIMENAKKLTERIANEADFTARQEVIMAEYRLREEAARLAVQVAEEVIKSAIGDDDRDRLLDEYLEKVMERES